MRRPGDLIALLTLCTLVAACASQPPVYHDRAFATLERVRKAGGESLRPAEFGSVRQSFEKGEQLLKEDEQEDAEDYFQLTLMKGELLEKAILDEKARQMLVAQRAEEVKRVERLRLAREEAQRRASVKVEAQAVKESGEVGRKKVVKPAAKEHQLVSSYTVRRGESLPFIASQPEVYGDRNLWPLIYRANRDQISDPRHIWPGQVLQIPRNVGRDDLAEAKRYAQERPLH